MKKINRYFQYISGERKNNIVVFSHIEEDDGIFYYTFKDGSRCSESFLAFLNASEGDLYGKIAVEVDSPNNVWHFKEEKVGGEEERWEKNAEGTTVCVQEYEPPKIKIIPVQPKPSMNIIVDTNRRLDEKAKETIYLKKTGQLTEDNIENTDISEDKDFIENNTIVTQQTIKINKEDKKKDVDTSPVFIMLDKAKKIETSINFNLHILLPSKKLYDVTKESFDDGVEKFAEYIINNLNVDELKATVAAAVISSYENNELDNE